MFTFPNAVLVEYAFIMKHGWWNVWYNLAHSLANRPSVFKGIILQACGQTND